MFRSFSDVDGYASSDTGSSHDSEDDIESEDEGWSSGASELEDDEDGLDRVTDPDDA